MRPIDHQYNKTNPTDAMYKSITKPRKKMATEKEIKELAAEIDRKRAEENRRKKEAPPSLLELLISKIIGKKYRFDTGVESDVIDSEIVAEAMLNIRAENLSSQIESKIDDLDVRNMTFDEFKQWTDKLYNKGEISLFDKSIMTFNPMESSIKSDYKEKFFKTIASPNGKRNWINEFAARYQEDAKLGNQQGCEHNKRIYEILKNHV